MGASDAVGDALLTVPVSPLHMINDGASVPLTALGYVSLPFTAWRGTLKYKIVLVANNYQRGRLRIIYDSNINAVIPANAGFNTTFSQVVDLHQGAVYEFNVGWTQPNLYGKLTSFNPAGPQDSGQIGCNGQFQVRVQTALTGSIDATTLTALVYVAAGDD